MVSSGDTRAVASVSGPIEVRLASEQASKATFEVIVRPLSGIPGTESKALSATIRSLLTPSLILTQNPRSLIQLVIQSLSPLKADCFYPPLIASLINASTLAVLKAGSVPMRAVVCAVSVGRLHLPTTSAPSKIARRPTLVVDPGEDEIGLLEGGGCFAFMLGAGVLTASTNGQSPQTPGCDAVWSNWYATSSRFDENEFVEASKLAKIAVQQVWKTMKASVGQAPFEQRVNREGMEFDVKEDEKMDI